MKKEFSVASLSSLFLSIFAASTLGHAEGFNIERFDFSAPTIFGSASIANPQIGDIIYDQTAGGFYGYTQAGSWTPFGVVTSTFRAPTSQKFTSGTGTYTKPTSPAPLYIKVTLVGGGGGGGGGNGSAGGSGGNTSFGGSLLIANGGAGGGGGASSGGVGGTTSVGSGPTTIVSIQGGQGQGGTTSSAQSPGGMGAASAFGGAGAGSFASVGNAAVTNSGSGGGGGGSIGNYWAASGGGAGGFLQARITSPSATYSFSVGAGGSGGSSGSGGYTGGAGGSGVIIVEEFYQ